MKTTEMMTGDNYQTLAFRAESEMVAARQEKRAKELSQFVPTLFELELLAWHWLNARLEAHVIFFLHQSPEAFESGFDQFAAERLQQIREALGEIHYAEFAADIQLQLTQRKPRPLPLYDSPWDSELPDEFDGLGYGFDRETQTWIGYVDEINGRRGVLCPGFTATLFDLEIIAKHWIATHRDPDHYYFVANEFGNREWRLIRYSERRLMKLQQILGDDRYRRISEQVEADFAEPLDRDLSERFRIPGKR